MMKNTNLKTSFFADTCRGKIKVFLAGNGIRLENGRQQDSGKLSKNIHYHFTYEIFFVGEDSLEISTYSGKETYEMKAVIISPRIKHYTASGSKDCFCLLLSRDDAELLSDEDVTAFPISAECVRYMRNAATGYIKNDKKSQKDTELFISLAFNEVFSKAACTAKGDTARKTSARHTNAIEQYINANIFGKVTLKDISNHIFLSTRQIARIINDEYGCGLCSLVNSKKLDAAEMLVKNTDIRISEIAKQINIGSENYFYSIFKKKFGMTPLQYRKNKSCESDDENENI